MRSILLITILSASTVAVSQNGAAPQTAAKSPALPAKSASPTQKTPAPAQPAARPRPQKVEDMMDSFQIMEKGFWQAWKDRNAKPFEQHMAPNSLIVDNTGITDKSTALNGITGCEVKNFSLSDFKLTKVDENNALLTYKADNIEAVCGKDKAPTSVFASTLFTKSGGKWWMLFHQESAAIANAQAQ